jgi:secondary thiamine-phosphate synthase enzyme
MPKEVRMPVLQKKIIFPARRRGFYLVTSEIVSQLPELKSVHAGVLHLFIKHTSASLTLNENADPTVRKDFESYFTRTIPDGASFYEHDTEGDDDMPAHLKASLLGSSVSIPITNGTLNLGTWQGIYFCEHRKYGSERELVCTVIGESTELIKDQQSCNH